MMSTGLHTVFRAAGRVRARLLAGLMSLLFVVATAAPAGAGVDPVLEWNDVARQLVVVPALTPVEQTRMMAIVHVALHDAVSAITREYERYAPGTPAPAGRCREPQRSAPPSRR